jgi:hypothetical protein
MCSWLLQHTETSRPLLSNRYTANIDTFYCVAEGQIGRNLAFGAGPPLLTPNLREVY